MQLVWHFDAKDAATADLVVVVVVAAAAGVWLSGLLIQILSLFLLLCLRSRTDAGFR